MAAHPTRRNALVAASLGWMLDSMDVMLYSMVISAASKDLHMTPGVAGGIFFGFVADRLSRTGALSMSILIHCLCKGLYAFVHTVPQLAICRMLLGLGMGGEWAAGAALVAETWPDEHRAKALAIVQSSWAIGYALATSSLAVLLLGPVIGFWGTGYFSGFSVIASEAFPTALRGRAMGFAYNLGRIASAAAPYAIVRASERWGMGSALVLTAAGSWWRRPPLRRSAKGVQPPAVVR